MGLSACGYSSMLIEFIRSDAGKSSESVDRRTDHHKASPENVHSACIANHSEVIPACVRGRLHRNNDLSRLMTSIKAGGALFMETVAIQKCVSRFLPLSPLQRPHMLCRRPRPRQRRQHRHSFALTKTQSTISTSKASP